MLGFQFPLKDQNWRDQSYIALSSVKHIHHLLFKITGF